MAESPSTDATTPQSGLSTPPAADSPTPLSHVQACWDRIRPTSTIYRLLFSNIVFVSASNGRMIAQLPLEPMHLNSKSTLHGSVSATIVDWAGGMAIASTGRENGTGVSVDIHVSYVSTARDGETIEIEAWVNRTGRSLAYTQVEIRKATTDGTKGKLWPQGVIQSTWLCELRRETLGTQQ